MEELADQQQRYADAVLREAMAERVRLERLKNAGHQCVCLTREAVTEASGVHREASAHRKRNPVNPCKCN